MMKKVPDFEHMEVGRDLVRIGRLMESESELLNPKSGPSAFCCIDIHTYYYVLNLRGILLFYPQNLNLNTELQHILSILHIYIHVIILAHTYVNDMDEYFVFGSLYYGPSIILSRK